MAEIYDPSYITPYFGKVFITKSDSRYEITSEGKISGRERIEGASIMMIAGIDPEDRPELLEAFHHSKEAYDRVLKEKASSPDIGKSLAISLTTEDARKRSSKGLVTSLIEKIE
jgi:hypothetical protein